MKCFLKTGKSRYSAGGHDRNSNGYDTAPAGHSRNRTELAAQTARVGVAEEDRYPKFSFTGSFGYQADSLGSLVQSSNASLSFGPSFSWALFDMGKVTQNIRVQTETQKKCLADYESAVLTAMEDVENALTAFNQEYRKNLQMQKAVKLASEALSVGKTKV